MKAGYAITTYKIQLNYKHLDWFKQTQSLFDAVLAFYYKLLEKQPETLELSNQNLLRHLELQTIKQRDGTKPEIPLPFEKIPLYFRRAAINAAISMYRSYMGKLKTWAEKQIKNEKPSPPKRLHMSMLYYKGMYKDFDEKSILLKLYTGRAWAWVKHRYTGRPFPENAELMSPTIVIKKKKVMLHIPVKEIVEDARTAKERVKQHESFVAVALTTSDTLAVCTTIQADGSASHPYFIKGGKELAHRRKQLLGYTKRSSAPENVNGRPNLKYYQKITRVTDHYAHEVSRKIVDYAVRQGAKLIVMPGYSNSFAKGTLPYLKTNVMDFIGRRIIRYTSYKAWQAGIVVTFNSVGNAKKECYHCGSVIYKYNAEYQPPSQNFYGGKNFRCKEGHKGSTALNTARNIGKSFYGAFYEKAG
ncbi:hypothetical protein LI142_09150 [Eubacterium limosum]|uniref:Transposase n=1 Tax=Eubacterium limosum TaxID=1736 RepID=A0ABT5UJS4_EUBLI|nr:hypothetical protein [Eubacterium limosum]MCB6569661.1 hypothetical protein [Eubacterium limosum]MDE1469167.1 hypothetical protein [Eubacterium limosum]